MDLERLDILEIAGSLAAGDVALVGGRRVRWEEAARIRIAQSPWPWEPVYEQEMDRLAASNRYDMQHEKEWHVFNVCVDVTRPILRQAMADRQEPSSASTSLPSEERKAPNPRDVWVVHGRNLEARDALFEFLTSIDLRPIEFNEARTATRNPTPYVGEILEAAFSSAQAVVVLLTPDDWAWLREEFQDVHDPPYEKSSTLQPRPNVLFEAGMAMGRDPKRTVLVQLGEIRPFSDVAGRHILQINDTPARRMELADRLADSGCDVRREGTTRWLEAGRFDAALPQKPPAMTHTPHEAADALVTARIDRDVNSDGSPRELLVLENRGAGLAEDIEVRLDGVPALTNPVVFAQNEIKRLGPFSRAHYRLLIHIGAAIPSEVTVEWLNSSGERQGQVREQPYLVMSGSGIGAHRHRVLRFAVH